MFIKKTKARSGKKTYTYLQLVESVWKDGKPTHRVVASLGRADRLDPDQIDRLITALAPYGRMEVLDPEKVSVLGAKEYGTILVLDHLWRLLGCDQILDELSQSRSFGFQPSLAVKAIVFSRIVDPCSERGVLRWLEHVHAPELDGLQLQHLYRSLDFLNEVKDQLESRLVQSLTARLFVDLRLVLLDTTSVYFEGSGPSELASYGYSRDKRPDRRQFILGLVTSREGFPIGHVVMPGNTSDLKTLQIALESVVKRLPVTEVILVMDRGMVSDENLSQLQEAGIQYIVGAKLRNLKTRTALAKAGRYKVVAENLCVKEVKLEEGCRHIICYNPIEAKRDRQQREAMVTYLKEQLSQGVKGLFKNGVARRYLRVKDTEVSLDEKKIKEDARYDGKWVLLTTTSMPADEVARSYKGLWQVEQAFRTLKSPLEIRPVYHWTERRVRGHVMACVLAYLLERIIDTKLQEAGLKLTAQEALKELSKLKVVDLDLGKTICRYRTELTEDQVKILDALKVEVPPKVKVLQRLVAK